MLTHFRTRMHELPHLRIVQLHIAGRCYTDRLGGSGTRVLTVIVLYLFMP